jgi:hypothetical protein
MASEKTDPPTGQESSRDQSSSESKSSEGDDNSGEAQSDPSTTEILEDTVDGSDQLTDPATNEHLKKAT